MASRKNWPDSGRVNIPKYGQLLDQLAMTQPTEDAWLIRNLCFICCLPFCSDFSTNGRDIFSIREEIVLLSNSSMQTASVLRGKATKTAPIKPIQRTSERIDVS